MNNDRETMDLFKKFQLVPAGTITPMSKVEKAEQQLRNYNPALRAMAKSYSEMNDALHGKKRGRSAKSRLNLLNMNRARLLHIHRQAGQTNEIPSPDTRVPQEAPGMNQVNSPEIKLDVKPLLAIPIPQAQMSKFRKLMDETGDVFRSGKDGEVVIRNQAIPGSSYGDVMRALIVNPKTGEASPRGLKQVIGELKRLGVSSKVLMSKHARKLYEDADSQQTGSGHFRGAKRKKKKVCKVLRLY